ncbi:hypothetical protein AB0F44_23850 [Nocardioides sp. NPDC023903]
MASPQADGGWVSYAGARGATTPFDETRLSDQGGTPAALPPDCEGEVN